ncbi:unnamed protein product, partial [Musa acuminata subsp. burmannicoides]
MATVASDLQARRVDPPGRHLFHPLHLLHLLSGSLPYQPSSCILFLRQLHLHPRHLPHPLSICILRGSKSDLLRSLLPQYLQAFRTALGLLTGRRPVRADAHRQSEIEQRMVGSIGRHGGMERLGGKTGRRGRQQLHFSSILLFHREPKRDHPRAEDHGLVRSPLYIHGLPTRHLTIMPTYISLPFRKPPNGSFGEGWGKAPRE